MLEALEPRDATRAARVESMAEAMRADVDGNGRKQRLYHIEINVDGGTQVQAYNRSLIQAVAGAVAYNIEHDRREKVDLKDTEAVRERIVEYTEACAAAGLMPTVSGLCGWSLKISRQWLSKFRREHPRHATTALIDTVTEVFADAVLNTSLAGATNAVAAIFQLKNMGYSDKPEFDDVTAIEPEDEGLTAERIKEIYGWLEDGGEPVNDYSAYTHQGGAGSLEDELEGGNNGDSIQV